MSNKLLLLCFIAICIAHPIEDGDKIVDQKSKIITNISVNPDELKPSFWKKKATILVKEHLNVLKTGVAKNVIFFLGDGMSIPTLAAARLYMGQLQNKSGVESELSFEKFPVTGLSKTYCVNKLVADSACSATAYLCGVKANSGTIGVNAKLDLGNCDLMPDKDNHVDSVALKFLDSGRSAGLVTTTRVTHASPAGVYAHTAHRDWENDKRIMDDGADPIKCRDIAHQLLYSEVGKQLKVILGGGRREFLPNTTKDEEGFNGLRADGRNLIDEWQKTKKNYSHAYVWNKNQLLNLKPDTEYLMGLFDTNHCPYNLFANKTIKPTLEEMTEAAIKILSKNKKGYFLFVEGGRIDHGHHDNRAQIALDETVEFSKAIEKAVGMTSREDTLIVVTSDHAHVMSFNGYPDRGSNILGVVQSKADDNLNYTILSYANGPGYKNEISNKRLEPTKDPIYGSPNYRYPATVPLDSETHGGDDVGVFALGPWQHLFTGVYEQSTIPYLVEYAASLSEVRSTSNSGAVINSSISIVILSVVTLCLKF